MIRKLLAMEEKRDVCQDSFWKGVAVDLLDSIDQMEQDAVDARDETRVRIIVPLA